MENKLTPHDDKKEKSPDHKRSQLAKGSLPPGGKKQMVKEIILGFIVTVICNLAGIFFCSQIFGDGEVIHFVKWAYQQQQLASVIGLGALLDFLAFFVFLRKGQFYRVRGVLLAVILAGILVLILKVKTW